MHIVVLVKRVPDTASVLKVAADGASIDTTGLKYIVSPYDEHALEAAIQVKEAAEARVTVVSLGTEAAQEQLRTGLAMGADEAALVSGPEAATLTPKGIAAALAAVAQQLGADVVLAGKQAVDDDAAQVPERIAAILDWPHVSAVSKIAVTAGGVEAERDSEGARETWSVPTPCVLSLEKGGYTPRYPKLPNIMKAKKKPIAQVAIADLGLPAEALAPGYRIAHVESPRQSRRNRILEGDTAARVSELVAALRNEEKVL